MEKVISIVGAGGKTTLVHKLAREYHRRGKGVLVTTTTHIFGFDCSDIFCPAMQYPSFIILSLNAKKSQDRSVSASTYMCVVVVTSTPFPLL